MQSSVFSITKIPRMLGTRKVFKISHGDSRGDSASERGSSAQETFERPVPERRNEFRAMQTLGKRSKCEKSLPAQPSAGGPKKTARKSRFGTGNKKISAKVAERALKKLEASPEFLLYDQACDFLKELVNSEINNELQRLEDEGPVSKCMYLERLEGIVKGMMKIGIGRDMVGKYLVMQSELIRNVSFVEFAKLMRHPKWHLNS
eukprot:TRINITY_DN3127_c0_g3_i5.p1 TRINITY_DN3127_c0_g3~~TRINITY_DN3127_c0_g3_i5.p1  ORF type:complete len:204 (-),score=43.74 TRINITY_DN3127_c0_g3_i5:98-709(-)